MPPGERHMVTISGGMSGWGAFIAPDIDHGLPEEACVMGTTELMRALVRRASEWTWEQHLEPEQEIGRAHVELQSLMRISYAVFCLKTKTHKNNKNRTTTNHTPYNRKQTHREGRHTT